MSFYSGYFGGHVIKLESLTLPNRMFDSVYIGPLRVIDARLMNMSSLDTYLSQLFREFRMFMCIASNPFTTVLQEIALRIRRV